MMLFNLLFAEGRFGPVQTEFKEQMDVKIRNIEMNLQVDTRLAFSQ